MVLFDPNHLPNVRRYEKQEIYIDKVKTCAKRKWCINATSWVLPFFSHHLCRFKNCGKIQFARSKLFHCINPSSSSTWNSDGMNTLWRNHIGLGTSFFAYMLHSQCRRWSITRINPCFDVQVLLSSPSRSIKTSDIAFFGIVIQTKDVTTNTSWSCFGYI